MKAIINSLRKTKCNTHESLLVSRKFFKFSNTKDGLWTGAKRYAH